MLQRLRARHPIVYCILAEVLFLGIMLGITFVLSLCLFLLDASGPLDANPYAYTVIQELIGIAVAVLLLARTGRLKVLTHRGCGLFNGLLVGMYPLLLVSSALALNLMALPSDQPMLPAVQVVSFLAGMALVGVAEEMAFRGIVAQTLLEHFGTSRAGVWKACLLSGLLFGAAHLINMAGSTPFGVLMQSVFAASLGTMYAAIYFRTGNLWVTVVLHAGMDITSMLVGGLYGTVTVSEAVSGYDATRLLSLLIYLLPTLFLLRKKKIGEVALYSGDLWRQAQPTARRSWDPEQ